MIYALETLEKKKSEALAEFTRVINLKTTSTQKCYIKFNEEADKDLAIINDKIKQLDRSIDILAQFVNQ
jgi:hypothetical protein